MFLSFFIFLCKVIVRDVLSNSDTDTAATIHSSLSDADSF